MELLLDILNIVTLRVCYLFFIELIFLIFEFLDNTAVNTGGDISVVGASSIVIKFCNFINSTALIGGSLYLGENSNVLLENSTISYSVSETKGGAVNIAAYAKPTFKNCTISNCVANSVGSGVNIQAFAIALFEDVIIR